MHGTARKPVDALLLRLGQHDAISPDERRTLEAVFGPPEFVPKGEDLVTEGDEPPGSTLMLAGLSFRYRTLTDGRRQIVSLHIPGDFVDLHSFMLKRMDHSVGAISDCTISRVSHEALRAITEEHPHLTRLLWLMTLVDNAIVREWLVGVGRRSAVERMAHLVCELHLRLSAVTLDGDQSFELPITQAELGDMLGLSLVHTNRVLRQLRERRLVLWEGRRVRILDLPALQALADFDDVYLHRISRPR